jgi:hypothetical protein
MSDSSSTIRWLASAALGIAILAGCSALGNRPYGEDGDAIKDNQPTDAPPHDAVHSSTDGLTSADAGSAPDVVLGSRPSPFAVDAAALDAASSPPTPRADLPNCSGQKGRACEDCCVSKIPGGQAISRNMDAIYDDCVFTEGCFTPDCFDYCDGVSGSQACAGSAASTCDEIDKCIQRSACY